MVAVESEEVISFICSQNVCSLWGDVYQHRTSNAKNIKFYRERMKKNTNISTCTMAIKYRNQETNALARNAQTMNGLDEEIYANMMKINLAPAFPIENIVE